MSVIAPVKVRLPKDPPYRIRQFRRHDRQACHQQMLDRKYYLDGKQVAVNRRKAMDQKKDSLEEYRQRLTEVYSESHAEKIISRLQIKEHKARYKNMERHLPGSIFVCNGEIFVMQRSHGFHNNKPDSYISVTGETFTASKCNFIHNNTGIQFVG